MGAREAAGARVVIAGGGTGGHLTPALALARELDRRGVEVLMVGGTRGPDRTILPGAGLPHRLMSAPSFDRRRWWRNAALPWTLARALATGRRIVRGFRPDVVVGTGGYVSVPVVLAGALARVPVLLQEQNRVPGLATRFLARWADLVCLQYEDTARALPGDVHVETTGSPIARPDAVPADFAQRLDPDRPTLGVFGGSQGARAINDAVLGLLAERPEATRHNLVWQTGAGDHDRVASAAEWPERFVIRPFFDPMAAVYPLLDLVVCRAGAMTLAEITAWGVPALLVPYPHATDDHQTANARALEEAGAAIVVPEPDLVPRRLGNLVVGLLDDEERRRSMAEAARSLGRPEAAATVADRVLELAA